MRDKILFLGVKYLKDFGYPSVNKDNIITDIVYSGFFENMLKETIDDENNSNGVITKECQKLLEEIQSKRSDSANNKTK